MRPVTDIFQLDFLQCLNIVGWITGRAKWPEKPTFHYRSNVTRKLRAKS